MVRYAVIWSSLVWPFPTTGLGDEAYVMHAERITANSMLRTVLRKEVEA